MGVGGGAQSCACGGCRWVTHPHRSLLHQFWWGKAPLIGFVENGLPPWRSGRGAAYGLTGGTVSWRVPYAGKARSGRLPPQPSFHSPARTPCRPPGRRSREVLRAYLLAAADHAGSGGQAVPTATSTVPPLSFSRCSCFANRRGNDALRGRLRLQVTPRARAAAGWKRGQVEPFRRPTTIPLDPASPGGKRAAIGFGQSQTRVPRVRIGIMVLLGLLSALLAARLIGVGLGLNPIECGVVGRKSAGGQA